MNFPNSSLYTEMNPSRYLIPSPPPEKDSVSFVLPILEEFEVVPRFDNVLNISTNSDIEQQNPEESYSNTTKIILIILLYIVPIIWAIFGGFGNILSIWILDWKTKKNAKSPNTICLLALSGWDLLVCVSVVMFVSVLFASAFIDGGIPVAALVVEIFGDSAVKGSTYTTVIISLQRVTAVFLPLRFSSLVTITRMKIACFLLVPVLIALEAGVFQRKPYQNLLAYYVPPAVVLLVCNGAIVIKLYQLQKQRQALTRTEMKNRKATVMLVTICGIHIIYLLSVLATYQTQGVLQFWFAALFLNLLAARPSINVIIYFVFGKTIRQGAARICCGCCCEKVDSGSSETPIGLKERPKQSSSSIGGENTRSTVISQNV